MTSKGKGTAPTSRREALKNFGRYAAVAPAAMVLLEPRASHAGKGKGKALAQRRRGKWLKHGGSHY